MIYVAFMTFVLIMSSVTMVLAVDAGHKMQKAKVTFYMFLTIIGGIIFVGSQAWEWATFIKGDYGAVKTKGGNILQFLDSETSKRVLLLVTLHLSLLSNRDQHKSIMEYGIQMRVRYLNFQLRKSFQEWRHLQIF